MTIGIDASRINIKNKTGTEYYSYNLIEYLLKVDKKNKYILYSRNLLKDEFKGLNFTNKILWAPRLWTQLRLSIEMLKAPIGALFVPAHAIPLIHPKKTIITIHGLEYEYFPKAYSFFERWHLKFATKLALKYASKIIAPSHSTKNDLIKFYKADPKKIKVIYHGYNKKSEIQNPKSETNSKSKITNLKQIPNTKYILFVGSIQPRKNIQGLIKAFEILNSKFQIPDSRFKLVIAGPKAWLCKDIFKTANKSKYKEDIIFTGYVSEQELSNLYKNAELFILPSLYEGFGFPILEAMSYGIPVITSNISSMPEIAGNAALLINNPSDPNEIAEAMRKLLFAGDIRECRLRREELIKNGFENVKRFSWEKCARETLDVLLNC